jgi:hypothetical protein
MSGAELAIGAIGIAGLFESSFCLFQALESTSQDDRFKGYESTLNVQLRQPEEVVAQAKDCIKDPVSREQAQKILEVCDEVEPNHLLEYGEARATMKSLLQSLGYCYDYSDDLEGLQKLEDRSEFFIDEKASMETVHPTAKRGFSWCNMEARGSEKHHAMIHRTEWVTPYQEPASTRTNSSKSQNSRWQIWRNQPRRNISTPRAMRIVGGILLLFPVCMIVMSNYAITSGLLEGSNSWYRSAIQVSLPAQCSKAILTICSRYH